MKTMIDQTGAVTLQTEDASDCYVLGRIAAAAGLPSIQSVQQSGDSLVLTLPVNTLIRLAGGLAAEVELNLTEKWPAPGAPH